MSRFLALLLAMAAVASKAAPVAQVFFIPITEDEVYRHYTDLNLPVDYARNITCTIAIAPAFAGTIVYYDQWENGFETDISNPANIWSSSNPGGTQIWGDNNPANGIPPGFATDVIGGGDYINLQSIIAYPHVSGIDFDGGDKMATTKAVSVSTVLWPVFHDTTGDGVDLAEGASVLDTSRFGTEFFAPVGINVSPTGTEMFQSARFSIMAAQNGTLVNVDLDGNGSVDATKTLAAGEGWDPGTGLVGDAGRVRRGGKVTATKPVQVHLLTGDIDAKYANRWFTLYPTALWSSDHYTPVGAPGSDPVSVFLYNKAATALTVTWVTTAASGTVTVPANSGLQHDLTSSSGVRFYAADGTVFQAVTTIDVSAVGTGHDWGATLIPGSLLSTITTVAFGPGSEDGSANGSPVWVVPTRNTTIYVDYDGDPATGPLVDSQGAYYDVAYTVSAFESTQVFDDTDNNQSGMRLYTLDGVKIVAMWGEGPAAGGGRPFIDAGTSIIPVSDVVLGDYVWSDVNADGVQDANEPGIPGVQVQVYTAAGAAYQYRTPLGDFADDFEQGAGSANPGGSDGTLPWAANWTFAGSTPASIVNVSGSNRIRITDPLSSAATRSFVVPAGTAQLTISYDYLLGSGDDTVRAEFSTDGSSWSPLATYNTGTSSGSATHTFAATPGTRYLRFVKTVLGSGGTTTEYMYFDNINILAASALASVTTTTDANGFYAFGSTAGLVAGTAYQLRVATNQAVLAGFTLTGQNLGGDDTRDSDATLATAVGFATLAFTAPPVNGSDVTLDFGFKSPASIGDLVWVDLDGNGVQGPGEPGVPNVTINMTWAGPDGNFATTGDNASYSTTTDANGGYLFTGLPAGNFKVDLDNTTLPAGLAVSTANDPLFVTGLVANQNYRTADFGVRGTGTLGDRIFHDIDGGNDFDAGEGLAGIAVTVSGDIDGDGTAESVTTATGADGLWTVTGLRTLPGGVSYTVTVATAGLPEGLTINTVDPDTVNPGNSTSTISLTTASPTNLNQDFGYRMQTSLGDRIWLDRDGDRVQEAGEPGINGVRVYVDTDNDNTFDVGEPSDVTAADGQYAIYGLAAGTYNVRVDTATLPSDVTQTHDLSGGLDNEASATLAANQTRVDVDFGYRGSLSLGDLVWQDVNDDGIASVIYNVYNGRIDINGIGGSDDNDDGFIGTMRIINGYVDIDNDNSTPVDNGDDGTFLGVSIVNGGFDINGSNSISNQDDGTVTYRETVIPSVRVYVDWNNNGVYDSTDPFAITSAANPNYTIGNLPPTPGDTAYTVRVDPSTLPASYVQTYDLDGLDTPHFAYVALTANRTDVDFGYRARASLGDRVWQDRDNDRAQDTDEPGLAGVRVYIDSDSDDTFDVGEPSAITAVDGTYTIGDLVAGTYNVRVDTTTLPAGAAQTHDLSGSLDHEASVTLTAGQQRTDVDFGYRGTGSLGDRVWNDLDGDRVQDANESGLAGVRVYIDSNGNGSFDANEPSATTPTDGSYTFANLLADTYIVRVDTSTLPSNLLQTYDLEGALDHSAEVLLTSGQTRTDVDFGYRGTGSIGDRIFADVNNSGAWDAGEGIAGVDVTLSGDMDGDGATENVTVTTTADGFYTLAGLRTTAGGVSYTVAVDTADLPAGMTVNTVDPDTANPGNSTSTVSLTTASPNRLDQDFGYRSSVTYAIRGQVRDDFDLDGQFSDPDKPVGNVTVRLYTDPNGDGDPSDGGLIATTLTATNGRYAFTNLLNGSYVVVETDPVYSVSTADVYGSLTDNRIKVTLNGADSNGNDFLDAVDPSGYLYDTFDGRIVPGGSISVTGPGAVIVKMDGSSGEYMFVTDGTAGNYTIAVTSPPGYVIDPRRSPAGASFDPTGGPNPTRLGASEDGVNPGYLTDASAASNTFYYTFSLASGDPVVLNNNFPLTRFDQLGDFVWDDLDADGIQDAGEPGITGVTVQLYDATSNLLATTGTDAAGRYAFTNLLADTYFVRFTPPPAYRFSIPGAGGNAALDSNAGVGGWTTAVTLTYGQPNLGIDAGLYLPAVVQGYTFIDDVVDLVRVPGQDAPVADMWVWLVRDNVVVATNRTDAGGYYRFEDVAPGAYTVLFDCDPDALIAVPTWLPQANDPERNRTEPTGVGDGYLAHVVFSGDGVVPGRFDEPLNAGFLADSTPLAAAIDIRALATAGGVTVEFRTIEEAGTNDIVLSVWLDGAWVEVGRAEAHGEGSHLYQFTFTGLDPNGLHDFKIVDDEGYTHTISNLAADPFEATLVRMERDGIQYAFDSLPDRTYDIYRAASPAGPWGAPIKTVTAEDYQTLVLLPRAPSATSAFFKTVLRGE